MPAGRPATPGPSATRRTPTVRGRPPRSGWPRAAWVTRGAGRQTFQRYVEGEWLPNHVIEVTTREGYTYSIGKHIMPWFGPLRMNQIMPADVREWVTHLTQTGVSPASIRTLKSILGAVFTTALNDQVTFLHPCKGVRTPTVPPQSADRRHARAVRHPLPGTPGRGCPAAGGDRHRKRPAVGGTRRAPATGPGPRHLHADGQPGRGRGQPQVPPRRAAVPGQALPERKETPPPEAQPPDRRQAHRPRTA